MKSLIITPLLLFCNSNLRAEVCQHWSRALRVTPLSQVRESSGLAVSSRNGSILTTNDGSTQHIWQAEGNDIYWRRLSLIKFRPLKPYLPIDIEALSSGPCPNKGNCIFIGDIGDNKKIRPWIKVAILSENRLSQKKSHPRRIVNFKYPKGKKYDAEAMAVHPNGDLYIWTKSSHRLFMLPRTRMQRGRFLKIHNLIEKGHYPLSKILPNSERRDLLVTGMDFSPNGDRLILVTYKYLIELNLSVSEVLTPQDQWVEGIDYKVTPLPNLAQIEAVTYKNNQSVYFSTEIGRGKKAELYKLVCLKR